MRHLKKGRKLNRTSSHRKAMMRNMAISFIRYGTIRTTLAKAKELRIFVEPLITLAKEDNPERRRRAFSILGNKEAVGKLFMTTAKICLQRPGGYLRILKAGIKTGDKSTMALVSLMDAPDNYTEINYSREEPKDKGTAKTKPAASPDSKDNTDKKATDPELKEATESPKEDEKS